MLTLARGKKQRAGGVSAGTPREVWRAGARVLSGPGGDSESPSKGLGYLFLKLPVHTDIAATEDCNSSAILARNVNIRYIPHYSRIAPLNFRNPMTL